MIPQVGLTARDLGPAPASARRLARELARRLGEGSVSTSSGELSAVSRDCWPKTMLWQRQGLAPKPPDVVVWPRNVEQVAEVLAFAREQGLAVTPYGAGSGVCGGAMPLRGGIVLDLKRLDRIRRIDREELVVDAEAGVLGLPLEQRLGAEGLTIGHFPSSIMVSTVGGWIAARGAGQCSARYGKVEDMVQGLTAVLGTGEVVRPSRPTAGQDLLELLAGSEGTLGVITDATLRLWPAPELQVPRGYRFPTMASALGAMRAAFRAGLRPSVLRLYDPFDTMIAMRGHSSGEAKSPVRPGPAGRRGSGGLREAATAVAAKRFGALKRSALELALSRPRGLNLAASALDACLLVVVHEGARGVVELEAERMRGICAAGAGRDLGEAPGLHWLKKRYAVSFKMPAMFAAGGWVDTCEVATSWGKVEALYQAVREAVSPHAFVMAHFSHAYPDGCSIYFSLAGAAGDVKRGLASYDAAWTAALDAADRAGATLTHHHGVGLLKAPWLSRELGEGGRELLRAAKRACDPAGILNPGKLGL